MSIAINIHNIKNYERYGEALKLGENKVEDELKRLKRQRKYNFERWRAKNLTKHREYMRQYHRDGLRPKTRNEIRDDLPKLKIGGEAVIEWN
jgi:hypothetical protein